jgi:acetyl-CoA carboxylase biotin carboxyl carrier protein
LDLKELKEILQILDEKEVSEFELEEEGIKLRIRKSVPSGNNAAAPTVVASVIPAVVSPVVGAPVPPAPAEAPAAAGPAEEAEPIVVVKSPIVGTFFRAPDPNSTPFVNVGDRVKPGQVLCIIEAMKLMNEIEAELAGEVVRVHRENGQAVQYGEPLFDIRPER